jgi:hypothetical protein
MPVIFTSKANFFASKSSFDNAFYKIAGDEANELFHKKTQLYLPRFENW